MSTDHITGQSFQNIPAAFLRVGDRIRMTFDGPVREIVSVKLPQDGTGRLVKFHDSTPGKSTRLASNRRVFIEG